jgi:hypothetical protein
MAIFVYRGIRSLARLLRSKVYAARRRGKACFNNATYNHVILNGIGLADESGNERGGK